MEYGLHENLYPQMILDTYPEDEYPLTVLGTHCEDLYPNTF
jgi:hypothetical protein